MPIEIDQIYLSNLKNSSGREYFVAEIREGRNTIKNVQLKSTTSVMTVNYPITKIEEYIREGRLLLVGKRIT